MSRRKLFCPYCGNRLERKQIDGRTRDFCPDCGEVIWKNPVPVAGVAVVKDGEVLMVKRGIEPDKGQWSLPAGFLEHDEEPKVGAARELEEETGVRAGPDDLEFLGTSLFDQEGRGHLLALVYSIEAPRTAGEVKSGSDAEDARFWKLEELEGSGEVLREHYSSFVRKAIEQKPD